MNKALLYYYFRDKEGLYAAALEEVAGKVAGEALSRARPRCSAGERVLRSALQHFDRILSQHRFQALMQQEMVRFRTGQSNAMRIIAQKGLRAHVGSHPATVEEGIRSGELCERRSACRCCTPRLARMSSISSARPWFSLVIGQDPLEPGSRCARRTAAIEYLGQTIFTDRKRGARLAKAVLAAVPIPENAVAREKDRMKPRNRIFIIMAVLLVVALAWYFFSTNHTSDLQLIGTVDANEVIVSSRIQGRIASLAVDEGQKVTAGQLVATIEARGPGRGSRRRRSNSFRPTI